jgi:hypothetical protein
LGGFVISPKILNYFFHIFCSTEIMALEFAWMINAWWDQYLQ